MNYFLTEEQEAFRQLAYEFAQGKIAPVAAEYDVKAEFPWPIVKEMARMDFFRLWIPEEYEGLGGGITEMCLVTEEMSRACGGIALALAGTALGTFPILISGNDEQKKKYLPALASGEALAAFCLTEPEAGSDAGAIQTTARLEGDHYILNGTKHFITNGGVAKYYTVIASTDPKKGSRGASAFIVEEGTEGLTFGKKEDKMGIRASATCEVVFQDCKIPKENLLAKEGHGFMVAMKTLDKSRPGVASQALGIAQGAFDHAVRYARERKQFGQSISSFQAIQHMLADMSTQIEAARALIYATAKMIDNSSTDYGKESAICKVFAGDTAMKVTTDAIQIFGGYGYMKDYPIEKYMRDAKITQIYEGTNQIQRNVIAAKVIRESAMHK
ncbi:MAG TPA: acyl-CoA dehydrogenase family protein [bacterium]|mgnify:CR=1 FL=1|nr:acyl-CoA dehydrogenase family protein [bacterium]HPN42214.1 acyl-CoA dehydrogenase family protein [bacterium]